MTGSPDWMVQLEFAEGTSSKFWRARVDGKMLYVNFGKIGTGGQTQVKEFGDGAAATKELDKLVKEKRKKGYQDAGAAGAAGAAAASDDENDDRDGEEEADDRDDAPAPAPARRATATPAKPASGPRFVLESGSRTVETTLALDGRTVRMDSVEAYATPEAAKKAFERLKRALAGEGYQER